jgi:hypothetical protein
MPDYKAHFITFTTQKPALTVRCLRGEGPPTPTGGYGGWEVQARPRKVSLTKWVGREPLKMLVPIILDDFEDRGDIEEECQLLEKMALPTAPNGEPPVVHVTGAMPHAGPFVPWVIMDIEWGDAIYGRSQVSKRIRQFASITLLRHVSADKLKGSNKAQGRGGKTGYRIYVVKRGDTLQGIAAHLLGNAARWREIARINNIRDPKTLKVGRRLKVPRQ